MSIVHRFRVALAGVIAVSALALLPLQAVPASAAGEGTVSGSVTLDGGGAALDGCVEVYTAGNAWVNGACVDGLGSYTVDVAPGSYRLLFWGFTGAVDEWHANAASFATATPVTVVAAGTVTVNGSLAPAGFVAGNVGIDGGGVAVGGRVTAYTLTGEWASEDYVDGSGNYFIDYLAPGNYRIFAGNFSNGVQEYYSDAATFGAATSVSVSASTTTTINFGLAVAGHIAGTVTSAGGGAATGGCATAYNNVGTWWGSDCVDEFGMYDIGGLLPGDFRVEFDSFPGHVSEFHLNKTTLATADPVSVNAAAWSTVDATLALSGRIGGTVSFDGGGTPSNGCVYIYDAASAYVTGQCGISGTYLVDSLAPGSYFVSFHSFPGAVAEYHLNAPDTSSATLVVVTSATTTTVDAALAHGGHITGTVNLDAGGQATSGWVSAYDNVTGDNYGEDDIDGSGQYDISTLPTGTYRLYVSSVPGTFNEWYNNKDSWSNAADVAVVAPATVSGVNISLSPREAAVIESVSPWSGPLAGGTEVTLTGHGFSEISGVTFLGVGGASFTTISNTQMTVTTPTAGVAGPVDIQITNSEGASSTGGAAFFDYQDTSLVMGTPTRILDFPSFTPGVVRCFPVSGLANVPSGATGVTLNVTTAGASGPGYVVVYPDYNEDGASPAPTSSSVNFEPGRDVANSASVALPANGDVCTYSQGGTLSRLILDVTGYVIPGSGVTLQNSVRLLDTRPGSFHVGDITGPITPDMTYDVQVTGAAGVPAGATAVIANVTVTGVTAPGHLRMWAEGTTMPNTSVVNYAPGQTKANGQIVALSGAGKLSFKSFTTMGTSTNPVQVIIDVVGYVSAGSQFVATTPTRIVETRASEGLVGPIPGALVPRTVYPVAISTGLVPTSATAVVLNVTAVTPTAGGNLRVYPDTNGVGTTAPPLASTLNYVSGRAIPNMVIVPLPPDWTVDFYNDMASMASRTHLVVDVVGYIDSL